MKLFAYYLPQFHCIPENDEWWGKGFTEWVNVKKAKPLYKNHKQPKVPLNNNYYSLDDVETLKWQAKLLEDYKVDGLIFYQYYFTGKKLLEKPAEMLLKNKDININFFFCWANHSWVRSWEGTKTMLMEQKYGTEKEWNEHFEYLLPFFKDDRYQKKENKPILMVFKSNFVEKESMFNFFNQKCKDNGFDGIYIIETVQSYNNNFENNSTYSRGIHFRESNCSTNMCLTGVIGFVKRVINKLIKISHKIKLPFVVKYNGNKLFDIMTKEKIDNMNAIRGLFFEWDNTPRHGYRGYVITPPDKKHFIKYMNSVKDNEYLFINAWNEWAEGMMLEPTEENKYKYLEWIKEWKENENRTNGM